MMVQRIQNTLSRFGFTKKTGLPDLSLSQDSNTHRHTAKHTDIRARNNNTKIYTRIYEQASLDSGNERTNGRGIFSKTGSSFFLLIFVLISGSEESIAEFQIQIPVIGDWRIKAGECVGAVAPANGAGTRGTNWKTAGSMGNCCC